VQSWSISQSDSNSFAFLGNLQITQLQHVSTQLESDILSSDMKHQLAKTLLASTEFSNASWKIRALRLAQEIITDAPNDLFLRYWAARRGRIISRLVVGTSANVLSLPQIPQNDVRVLTEFGRHVVSAAQDLVEVNKFKEALSELEHFPVLGRPPSLLEKHASKERDFIIARIHRLQGDFQRARDELLRILNLEGTLRKNLLCHLADVWCELENPAEAERLIIAFLDGSENYKKDMRVWISLAEAYLHQNMFQDCETLCMGLEQTFKTDSKGLEQISRKFDRMLYTRLMTIFARCYHLQGDLDKAMEFWNKASKAANECRWEEGFVEGIIHLSISHIKAVRVEKEAFNFHMKEAERLLERAGLQYWWTGLATMWKCQVDDWLCGRNQSKL
jgi:tetratricopeptide (TPR) repeat protein